jgi:hypothetical protein
MVWFTVGTLRELAIAIRDLRSALAKADLLDANSEPWKRLRDVESRWEDDPFYREMRNIVSFHVDPKVVDKGLEALAEKETVKLCEGDGPRADQTSLTLGLEAVFMGCDREEQDFRRFFEKVSEDHGVPRTIQEAFLLALEAARIPVERKEAAE